MQLNALILSGYGINCEHESKYCIEKVGGKADIVHINSIIESPAILENYNMLLLPGGFSYADDLGSGKVLASKLKSRLRDPIEQFIKSEKLVLGIGNGFQTLVKLGLLPEPDFQQRVSFTKNDSGKFEDRWVMLKTNSNSPCIFTKGIDYLFVPVRHGEGKFVGSRDELTNIMQDGTLVFQYIGEKGELEPAYPYNPSGSAMGIAGICDKTGRIFGMMPHPEAFNMVQNCPYWTTGIVKDAQGLKIFANAVEYWKGK